MKVRQDAWSEEDDLLLAETVLRHIREGSTQLRAFDEVGDKLNRTSAACGFRWNAVVRNRYNQAIQLAKKQRKERKRAEQAQKRTAPQQQHKAPVTVSYPANEVSFQEDQATVQPVSTLAPVSYEVSNSFIMYDEDEAQAIQSDSLSLDEVISYLQSLRDNSLQENRLVIENERLRSEYEEITEQKEQMARKLTKMEQEYQQMQDDYQALLQIMDRARRMVLMDETDKPSTAFRMDRNGNLEKIAESQ